MSSIALRTSLETWPVAVAAAEPRARFAILEFFAASISNQHTRRAYIRAARDFFVFTAPMPGGDQLATITSLHVVAWLELMKARGLSAPTIKLRLAALRMLFEALLRGQIIAVDPTAAVRGPRYSVTRGKTPVLDGAEVEQLLRTIDRSCVTASGQALTRETLSGLRDRAVIVTMAYSFARIGAVTALKVSDVFRQKQRLWLRLSEKGGKVKDVPCHHRLEEVLAAWLEASGLGADPDAPLFQSFLPTRRREDGSSCLSGKPLRQSVVWRMVTRRCKAAGLTTAICNHTFRAAGITA